MATFTNWFNLIKPSGADGGDLVNVDQLNSNMDIIDGALHQDDLDLAAALARIATLEALETPKAASVIATAPQNMTASTSIPMSFSTVEYDNDGMWNPATPTFLTVKTAGLYLITGFTSWASGTGGSRIALITKNGGQIKQWAHNVTGVASSDPFACVAPLAVNDQIGLSQYQSSTSNPLATHNQSYPMLGLTRLGTA